MHTVMIQKKRLWKSSEYYLAAQVQYYSVSSNIFLTVCYTLNIKLEFHLETHTIFLTFSQNGGYSLIAAVFPNSFLHFELGTTELLLAFDSLRQPGLPPLSPFVSIFSFCFGISVLDFLVLEYQLYLLCIKKLFLSYSYQLCIQ